MVRKVKLNLYYIIVKGIPVTDRIYLFPVILLALLFLFIQDHPSFAQRPGGTAVQVDTARYDSLTIDRIFIVGNRRTREQIIRREMDFTDGDKISSHDINRRIKRNEDNIFNSRLFLSVNISLVQIEGDEYDIIVRVTERWYFFPIPVLEIADRNFHDWWVNQDHDLGRIEWGLKLYQYNVRGMNETLKLTGQFGFTKKIQVAYSFPYMDRNQKIGLNLVFDYRLNKNINYRTVDHKYRFLDSEQWLREQYSGGLSTTYRKSLYSFHSFGASYYNTIVNDTILDLNPNYFSNGTKQEYFRMYYSYIHDKRDIKAYPLSGSYFSGRIEKIGVGIFNQVNLAGISALYNKFFDLGKHFYFTAGAGGSIYLPQNQPYNLQNAMGIGRFTLRGYELYVIEGPYFIQNQYTLRKLLFQTESDIRNILSARQFSKFHLALYLKSYFDLGYVNGYDNNILNTVFTNQLIYGGGFGLDVVTFYDVVFRLEYSLNKAGESGFVFGVKSPF